MAGAVAGLVLMQLALPKLRTSGALRTFSQHMTSCKHDLDLWRARCPLRPGRNTLITKRPGAC